MPDPKHPANQIHPSYIADRDARALSLAFKEGTPAFRRDGGEQPHLHGGSLHPASGWGRKRWVRPAEGEFETKTSVGYKLGMAIFDERVARYRTTNDYGDSLRTSATQPFDYVPTFEGWDPVTEARLNGEGLGLDGMGSSMKDMHAQAFVDKLFAGIHFIRIDVTGGVPIWVQTSADSLLNWRTKLTADGLVLSHANIESVDDSGALLRTVLDLGPGDRDVLWTTYRAVKTAESIVLDAYGAVAQHVWEVVKKPGRMVGLWSIPLEPFSMFWSIPYRSPVPFADAAEIQLSADEAESLLGSYRRRVSNSPAFVVSDGDPSSSSGGSGYGANRTRDENDQPRPLKTSGGALLLGSDSARASWESLDTMHIPHEAAKLREDYDMVRRKCQDPLLSTYRGGPTTATEVDVHDARSMSWLRLALLADRRSLRRLAGYTAFMSGSSPDGEILIRVPTSAKQRSDLVLRVEEQVKMKAVSKRILWQVCAENLEGYPTVEEIEELSEMDEEPEEESTESADETTDDGEDEESEEEDEEESSA